LNVKVVIELDGNAEEVRGWLARLGLPASDREVSLKSPYESVWSPALMGQLVERISGKARDALRVMAEGAPEVSFEQVQDALGVDGLGLGGVLASFGFAERAGLPRPYKVDKSARRYFMDEKVAQLALDALNGSAEV
jgi:hypothetical protein